MNNLEMGIEPMEELKKVAIIGCGWAGKALAQSLTQDGISVVATTRSRDNFPNLVAVGCQPVEFELPLSADDECNWLDGSDAMIIAITPQFKQGAHDYNVKVAQLTELAVQHGVRHVVLLSSTGVYQGTVDQVTEQTALDLSINKVELLAQAEQAVLSSVTKSSMTKSSAFENDADNSKRQHRQATVLRLAGLVGPNRHPARFMSGKQGVANASTPVNLVHQADVVKAIRLVLSGANERQSAEIYNVVSDTHPTRQDFYRLACQQLSLENPAFSEEQESSKRVVLGDKIQHAGLVLSYPDLMHWLTQPNS